MEKWKFFIRIVKDKLFFRWKVELKIKKIKNVLVFKPNLNAPIPYIAKCHMTLEGRIIFKILKNMHFISIDSIVIVNLSKIFKILFT